MTESLGLVGVVSSMIGSAVRHLGGEDMMQASLEAVPGQQQEEETSLRRRDRDAEAEKRFETALSHQFV